MVIKTAFTSAGKAAAAIAAIIAMPFVLASGIAAVSEFSEELITVMVLAGLVVLIGLATIVMTET